MGDRRYPCPYCSTFANGMRLYGPTHPCLTVYDHPTAARRTRRTPEEPA